MKARLAGDLFCDRLHRYLLSTDGSIFQKMPAGVVYPRTVRDVVETVAFADLRLDALRTARNAGTVQNLKDRRHDLYRVTWNTIPSR